MDGPDFVECTYCGIAQEACCCDDDDDEDEFGVRRSFPSRRGLTVGRSGLPFPP
jgi:hypothetical protein